MGSPRLKFYFRSLVVIILAVLLAVIGIIATNAARMAEAVTSPAKSTVCCQTPAGFGAGYTPVKFNTADGLALAAWFIPPRNGAVIILVHSYYSDRRQTLPVAAMLYHHGYGVLMYDQRASGESAGSVRSLGALDIPDLDRAAEWLKSHDTTYRLGVYGCSMGGAIAISGAAAYPELEAVAADAPSPLGWRENVPAFNPSDPMSMPTLALYYQLVLLRSGAYVPADTREAVRQYGTRPILFISSGSGEEYERVQTYYAAAIGPKSHWNIPETGHCGGPGARPAEYEQKLVDFFNSTFQIHQ